MTHEEVEKVREEALRVQKEPYDWTRTVAEIAYRMGVESVQKKREFTDEDTQC